MREKRLVRPVGAQSEWGKEKDTNSTFSAGHSSVENHFHSSFTSPSSDASDHIIHPSPLSSNWQKTWSKSRSAPSFLFLTFQSSLWLFPFGEDQANIRLTKPAVIGEGGGVLALTREGRRRGRTAHWKPAFQGIRGAQCTAPSLSCTGKFILCRLEKKTQPLPHKATSYCWYMTLRPITDACDYLL